MTLRDLLNTTDYLVVCNFINKKDNESEAVGKVTLTDTIRNYKPVIDELKSKPKVRRYHMPILVQLTEDWFDKHKYPDVCFLNRKYVSPPKGFKPWGGSKNIPKGHYNCNLNKYNRTYAMGWTPWSKIIDTPVVNDAGFSNEQLLAEILWELTFYGWSEEKVNAHVTDLKHHLSEAKKKIFKGKLFKFPLEDQK